MASNLFLDASELMQQNDQLNYINYDNLRENNREFLRSDTWDFEFTIPAAAVYFPGNALLKRRMINVNPQFPVTLSQMTAVIRQFSINQQVFSGTTSGTISIDYMDFEDQAIMAWLDDWRDKIGGRKDRYAFRKEDVVAEGVLTIMNSSRRPIRKYTMYAMQLQDPGQGLNPQLTSDDAQNVGNISASWVFEHYDVEFLNI